MSLAKYANAGLEQSNPDMLRAIGNYGKANPYLMGGLGLGAAGLAANGLFGGKSSMMGGLGTLGLMGGAGYLLDRVGGLDGVKRNWDAYQNFKNLNPDAEIGGLSGAIDKFNWFNDLPIAKQKLYADPKLKGLGDISKFTGNISNALGMPGSAPDAPATSGNAPAYLNQNFADDPVSSMKSLASDAGQAWDKLNVKDLSKNFSLDGVSRGLDAYKTFNKFNPNAKFNGLSGAVDMLNNYTSLTPETQETIGDLGR